MEIAFVIGRVILALYFITSGLNHFMKKEDMVGYARSRNLPSSKALVALSGLLLLLAGLGILLGVYIVWSLLALIVFLVLVAFMMHHFWTDEDPKTKMSEMMSFRSALAIAGALLMILVLSVMGPIDWPLALF